MKKRYLSLMEKALSAYTDEHILRYFNDVKTKGLTEHGFPRLTANLGILIAHGIRRDLLPIFVDMMDVCCDMFLRPYVKAANEFSVREIVCCIRELEDADAVGETCLWRWKQKISAILPEECYNVVVKTETDRLTNWAIFGAVSEYARAWAGLGNHLDFVDRQLSCQFRWLDENGMYRDNPKDPVHQPMMYDYVARGLFAMLLHFGYRGKYYAQIDDCLRRAGLWTLKMQSPNGEIPFGGRSNQFLLCEGWQAQIFEFEANRYAAEGDAETAALFKRAAAASVEICEAWLSRSPVSHIKNRFPTETRYGCEDYGYFDKYMITVASNFYVAYLVCNEDLPAAETVVRSPYVLTTSDSFHKLFVGKGDYQLAFDLNADPHYDANGLGRVQRAGAPSAICMSCPCPAEPVYHVDVEAPFAYSMCSAIRDGDGWHFGADKDATYEVQATATEEASASATLLCRFAQAQATKEYYTVTEDGVSVRIEGDGEIGYALPAFCFDGEVAPRVTFDEHSLTVAYEGWVCKYTTDGSICDLQRVAANRNGHYRVFVATANRTLNVTVEITKA